MKIIAIISCIMGAVTFWMKIYCNQIIPTDIVAYYLNTGKMQKRFYILNCIYLVDTILLIIIVFKAINYLIVS